jgi:hypothetical protein
MRSGSLVRGKSARFGRVDLLAREHHVIIRPTVAKKRRKRWIDLAPHALAWLDEFKARGGHMEGAIVPLSASTLRRNRRRNALAAGLTEWPQQRALIPTVPVGCVSMATSISWSCKPGHESAATMWDTIIKQSPQKPPRPSGQSIHRWPNNAGSLRLQNDR